MTVAAVVFICVLLLVYIISELEGNNERRTLREKLRACAGYCFWTFAAFVVAGSGYL